MLVGFRPFSILFKSWNKAKNFHPAVRWTVSTLIWLPAVVVFTENFYTVRAVRGRSMQPTLNPDLSPSRDVVIFDRRSVRILGDYQRGDVVALWSPTEQKLIVKRLIALEGDIVKTLPPYPDTEVVVPPGHGWVEGDEPFKSEDSNQFGPVPLALVDSKLSFIVYPFERFGRLPMPRQPDPTAPRDSQWRSNATSYERQRWRNSRVTVHPGNRPTEAS